MNHQVVPLRVVRVAIDRQRRLGALIRRMNVVDLDVDPPLKSLLKDVLLLRVIVAATAGDQQHAQRLGQRFLGRRVKFPGKKAGQY